MTQFSTTNQPSPDRRYRRSGGTIRLTLDRTNVQMLVGANLSNIETSRAIDRLLEKLAKELRS